MGGADISNCKRGNCHGRRGKSNWCPINSNWTHEKGLNAAPIAMEAAGIRIAGRSIAMDSPDADARRVEIRERRVAKPKFWWKLLR